MRIMLAASAVSSYAGPYVSPAPGPFVTHGRVPDEPPLGLAQLSRHVNDILRVEDDADVTELADLIHRARRL